jgi:hypothetical protein
MVLPVLEAIRDDLPLPPQAPPQVRAFAPVIKEAARLPLVEWALLDSLIRAWGLTTNHRDVLGEVSQWLSSAPIENFLGSTDPERLDAELATLSGFFDFHPAARLVMGARLVAVLPHLTGALTRHRFIMQ